MCTPGITAPHNRTYPEYSWSVLCVVSGYAVGVLCSVLLVVLYAAMYSIPLHHLAMLHVYTEVEGVTTRWTMAKEM